MNNSKKATHTLALDPDADTRRLYHRARDRIRDLGPNTGFLQAPMHIPIGTFCLESSNTLQVMAILRSMASLEEISGANIKRWEPYQKGVVVGFVFKNSSVRHIKEKVRREFRSCIDTTERLEETHRIPVANIHSRKLRPQIRGVLEDLLPRQPGASFNDLVLYRHEDTRWTEEDRITLTSYEV